MPTFDEILDYLGGPHITIELLLAVLFTVLVIRFSDSLALRRLRYFDRHIHQFARNRSSAIILVFVLALFGRIALLPILPVPEPHIHDEFSYLLAADTFAHGHITNRTPSEWEHFETFHVLMQPTYMSMYPPGTGLMMALGQRLGCPWIGVLLTTSFMCAVLVWALQAWLPPGWALYGGLLAVVRIGLVSYWVNSYWGGSLAAVGGALLIGAVGRHLRSPRRGFGIIAGVGIGILEVTRPFEGLVFCAAVALVLLWLAFRTQKLRLLIGKLAVPAVLIASCFLAWLAFYFWRVTGSPFTVPHVVEARTYCVAPNFLWQHLTPRTFRHPVMQGFYGGWAVAEYRRSLGFAGVVAKFIKLYRFYFAYLLTIPLLMAVPLLRSRKLRPLWIVIGLFSCGLLCEVWMQPHYAAPALVVIYIALMQGLRYWRVWPSRRRRKGAAVPMLVGLGCVLMLTMRVQAAGSFSPQYPMYWDSWPVAVSREGIIDQLEKLPGRHLVLVRYTPTHSPHNEWVYNRADIAGAQIIWAREMNPAADAALIAHYGQKRTVWRLYADANPPALEAYNATSVDRSRRLDNGHEVQSAAKHSLGRPCIKP